MGDNATVIRNSANNNVFTTNHTSGGADTITGDAGVDIVLGGAGGDTSESNR